MTTNEAIRKENENKPWGNLYPELGGKTLTPTFSIGIHVRIAKKAKTFDKDTLKIERKRHSKFLKFNCPFHWHIK